MIFKTPDNEDKSFALEYKADKLAAKNEWRKAYVGYKKAADLNDTRIELIKKLLGAMEQFQDSWNEDDFVENVHWAMKLKEIEDPAFKRIHARGEPEFEEITNLIQTLFKTDDQSDETSAAESIVAYGTKALYPLLDYLITFKTLIKQNAKPKAGHEKK